MTTEQLDELQRNIVGSLMSLLDGTMLDVDYPHARRETVAAAPAAIFEALKTRDAMLAELATLHHITM